MEPQSTADIRTASVTLAVLATIMILGVFLPWVSVEGSGSQFIFGENLLQSWTPDGWPWSGQVGTGNLWPFSRTTELEAIPGERALIFVLALATLASCVAALVQHKVRRSTSLLIFALGIFALAATSYELISVFRNMNAGSRFGVELSFGIGPWVCAVSALLMLYVGISMRKSLRTVEKGGH